MRDTPTVTNRRALAEAPSALLCGQIGSLTARAELVAGQTRLTTLHCRPPIQALRALHLEPDLPDLAHLLLTSVAGGVLQGDQLSVAVYVGPGARLHLGTTSATRIYRMPDAEAVQETRLVTEGDSYLEQVQGHLIPYAGARFAQNTEVIWDPASHIVLLELIGPGRAARGEACAYERVSSRLRVSLPNGETVVADHLELDATNTRLGALGGRGAVGTLLVLDRNFDAQVLREVAAGSACYAGAGNLPLRCGAWMRVIASRVEEARPTLITGWAAARKVLLGTRAPEVLEPA